MRTIKTERLLLRPFKKDDSYQVAKLCNNIKIFNNTLFLPFPYSQSDALSWISYLEESYDIDRAITWAVTDKCKDILMGSIGILISQIHKHAEIGYWLGEEFWGKGYMTEACMSVIHFCFEVLELHRVYAFHFSYNTASGKVMQRAGMKFEGISKGHIKKGDNYLDVYNYGITNER